MNESILRSLLRLLVIMLLQVVVFNNVYMAGYITPLAIGYVLVCLGMDVSREMKLLLGFLTGLLYDVFSNTPGMASASCTLLAMTQPTLLRLFAPRDASETFKPTIRSMGMGTYFCYALFCMVVLHTVFYLLDAFSLANILLTLSAIGGGSLLAAVICVIFELMVRRRR